MGQEAKAPAEMRLLGPDYFPKGLAAVKTVWFIILGNILEWYASLRNAAKTIVSSVSIMKV